MLVMQANKYVGWRQTTTDGPPTWEAKGLHSRGTPPIVRELLDYTLQNWLQMSRDGEGTQSSKWTSPQLKEDLTALTARAPAQAWQLRYNMDLQGTAATAQTLAREWWSHEGPPNTPLGWARSIARTQADAGRPYSKHSTILGEPFGGITASAEPDRVMTYVTDQLIHIRGGRPPEGGHLYKYDWRGVKFPNQAHPRWSASHPPRRGNLLRRARPYPANRNQGASSRCVATSH